MPRDAVRALLGGDRAAASALLGLGLPAAFPAGTDDVFLQVQLARMEEDPGGRGWCVRAMVRKEDSPVIGHCGSIDRQGPSGAPRMSYTIFQKFRCTGPLPGGKEKFARSGSSSARLQQWRDA